MFLNNRIRIKACPEQCFTESCGGSDDFAIFAGYAQCVSGFFDDHIRSDPKRPAFVCVGGEIDMIIIYRIRPACKNKSKSRLEFFQSACLLQLLTSLPFIYS